MKDEIFMGLRFLFLIGLILIIINDIEIPLILHKEVNQMIIAIFVISIVILVDEIIGLLIGIIFLVLYFKHYQKMFSKNDDIKEPLLNNKDSFVGDIKPETNARIPLISDEYKRMDEINGCIEMPYISNEILERIQTNIYDISNYNNEIKINENSYGIQGLNSDSVNYAGFDKNEIINNYL